MTRLVDETLDASPLGTALSRQPRRHRGLAGVVGLMSLLGLLGGCASSDDPTRYYQLLPVPVTAPAAAVPAYELVVDTVRLPEELDRAAMVVRHSPTQSRVLDDHRWLSPLSDQLTHTLVSNLQSALPQAWVRLPASPARAQQPRFGLRIEVEQMALSADARVTLVASWTLLDAKNTVLRRDRAALEATAPASSLTGTASSGRVDPDALARAASQAVAQLAEQIAQSTLQAKLQEPTATSSR
ncbi:MAG: PqiC family protein [Pseudomonadota bacterium]